MDTAVQERKVIADVPDGYKRTELGVIPKDWEIVEITDVTGLITDGAHLSPPTDKYGLPIATVENLKNGSIDLESCRKISHEDFKRLVKGNCKPELGDVLVSKDGTIGISITIEKKKDVVLLSSIALVRPLRDKIVSKYLSKSFSSDWFFKYLNKVKSGSALKRIVLRDLRSYYFPLPPTLEEQQAIAEALSDVDALIAELNALIEKKQQVKKGAMQQLLTPNGSGQAGKKRLPGFDGEWEKKTLDEIGNTYNGLSGKSGADFGDGNRSYIPFLNVMNNPVLDTSKFDTVKIKSGESQSTAEKGDLFFNTSSETPEEVGMCSVLLEDVENLHLNSFCFGFRLFDEKEVVPLFLAYYFRSQYGREHMKSLAQGSTRYNLSKSKFINIEVALPSYIEQKAIAKIISDMDAEIQALQAKRSKYEKIKQGMMQELLTGKTRLA